ncbi:DUF3800 domain-containing protein [Lentilactobacillus sp. TOM.63]|uniref:DUF3800 domain-containing protein n=1 Tax=Lentilactobacillus TaxID=2767893 RepID=UPI0021A26324|nr:MULTISPECIES: DUF3800 domain-containing protein [Lentilactobacillus]MCT3542032.1 DUF3800 domain-containing protein [Lentilactobacillus buchneri]MDM7515223.1 DUF3800 domain-containing protein [Lentilactobacillus sp. TOM.63]
MECVSLYIDESGNFGLSGRYFTLASLRCIDHSNFKLNRAVKKASLKIKKRYDGSVTHTGEVKASLCNPIAKDFMLRKIKKSVDRIDYITADLPHIEPRLLHNQNILYNYLLTFLISPIIKNNSDLSEVYIYLDNRTLKVGDEMSFSDYIKSKVWIDYGRPDVVVEVHYVDSQSDYHIQGADFVANAINGFYEHGTHCFTDVLKPSLEVRVKFPYKLFGK